MAPVAPIELEAPVEIAGNIAVQRDSVELEPVKLEVDLAKTSGASPPTPVSATSRMSSTCRRSRLAELAALTVQLNGYADHTIIMSHVSGGPGRISPRHHNL
jgi:hypothetical protein